MKHQAPIASLMYLSLSDFAYADDLVAKANHILSTTPEAAFAEAIEKNDLRFLHTPVCAEGMPGFNFSSYRGKEPKPKEIWSTCAGLMGEERCQPLLKSHFAAIEDERVPRLR